METIEIVSAEAVSEIQQMIEMPLEDQAGNFELALLNNVLQNGMQSIAGAESQEDTCDILGQIIKSAFVIGRRQTTRLV